MISVTPAEAVQLAMLLSNNTGNIDARCKAWGEQNLAARGTARPLVGLPRRHALAGGVSNPRSSLSLADTRTLSLSRGRSGAPAATARPSPRGRPIFQSVKFLPRA